MELALQKAIYTKLSASAIGASIYDTAPQSADGASTGAYITIGYSIASESDTWTKNGLSVLFRIHTFSRSGSMLECRTIQSAIYAALHRQPLTVVGNNNYELFREDSTCFADQDSKIHGVCEYRALVEVA